MSLEELNEKLHGRDVHLNRVEQRTSFDPEQSMIDANAQAQFQETEAWSDPITRSSSVSPVQELMFSDISTRRRRRNIAFTLGGIALLLLLGGLFFKLRVMLFNESQVDVAISGPKNVASAEETTFSVTYTNSNWLALENATIVLSYPESFHLQGGADGLKVNGALAEIVIGEIKADTQGKTMITGKFYGSKGDLIYLKATLRYTPSGTSTLFEKTIQFGVNVASPPLSLEITAPIELATGQEVEYVIDYSNVGDLQFSNLRVKADYPDGFQFVSAEPRPSEGNSVWYVGNLDARAQGKIVVRGVLAGTRDEYKRIRGMIGFFQGDGKFVAYAENDRQTHIVASPFAISQTVNGLTDISVNPGDLLQYAIHYKNESTIGMRDAIVIVEINPSLLDTSRLILKHGAYDAERKIIVWKASDLPELSKIDPGASGEINFSVPVFSITPIGGEKNLSIRSVAKIDSPDVPTSIGSNKIIGSNALLVKLNSAVNLVVKTFYGDTIFPNSGPFPPQIGKATSYTIHVSVANSSNDLKQSRVSVLFPTGVHYNGKFSPAKEVVSFNDRTNELTWDLGTLAPTEGDVRELVFQITATPSLSNLEDPLILMNSAVFSAKDAFTNQDVRVERGEEDSILQDDVTYKSLDGRVQNAQ